MPRFRARSAIRAMAAVPALLLGAGILCPPNRPRDVIAVSTVCLIFPVLPSLVGAAVLVPRSLRTRWPAAARLTRAACLSVAALLIAGDFWLIGIFGGAKFHHGVISVPLASCFIVFTLMQSTGSDAP